MRRIAFWNEKGGTCKTTLCVNVAARLAAVPVARYDLALPDAPPSQSLLTENVLRAAHELVVPVALTYLALDGCAEVLDSLDRLRAERGRAPEIALVVATLHRRTQLAGEILDKLRERFPGTLSRTVLGWSVKVDEAQSHGLTIFEHAPRSPGAKALAAIADEILERGEQLRRVGG